MKKERVDRIKQLEKAIYGLRGMNHADSVRNENKQNNLSYIMTYTNELTEDLFDELEHTGRHELCQYTHEDWLGQEFIYN
jgi:hypothetical protein